MTSFSDVFGGSTVQTSEVSFRAFTIAVNTTLTAAGELSNGQNVSADIMGVTASVGGLTLRLPPATNLSEGYSALVKNVGVNSFTLANNSGTTIATIPAGAAWYAWLVDNATTAGVWDSIQFGAATSSAVASALAGGGLVATGSLLAADVQVDSFNSTYTTGAPDRARLLLWTGGSGTLNLPTPSSLGEGWFIYFRNGGSGTLTIDPAGTDLIDGVQTIVTNPGESLIIATDGTQYYSIGYGRSAAFAFTLQSVNIAGTGDYTLSAVEQNKTVYTLTGVLTGNRNLIVPNTAQQYWIDNSTTGAFTVTVKTAAGAGVVVAQGQRAILYCNGTSVLDADTAGISTPIAIVDGGTGATTASAARTNLGATATGGALFTAASAAAGRATLGSTTVGDALFIAATAGAARTTLGSTATGDALFTAATAAAARTTLGSTATGDALFTAATAAAARTTLGSTATGDALFTAATAAAARTTLALGTLATASTIATADITNNAVTAGKIALGTWTSVASAATVDLGAQTSRNIVITGTTGITSFGTTATSDNLPFYLRFSAALTLTNGANLILPTGANITTAAGDVAVVVWEGANVWRVIDYTRASGQPLVAAAVTGRVLQNVGNVTSAFASGTTTIPVDDTVPTSTEGDQYLSQAITPQSSTSTLEVEATLNFAPSTAADVVVALFDGTTCVQGSITNVANSFGMRLVTFTYRVTSGSTSARTFTVRAGMGTAGTLNVNGYSGARLLGTLPKSSLYIKEIS